MLPLTHLLLVVGALIHPAVGALPFDGDFLHKLIHSDHVPQCSKNNCYTVFTNNGVDHPLKVSCDAASGSPPLTLTPHMSFNFIGDFDMCETFPSAHYCMVQLTMSGQPFGYLGQCVSKECSQDDLFNKYNLIPASVKNQTHLDVTVHCADLSTANHDAGYYLWVTVAVVLLVLVFVASVYDKVVMESSPPKGYDDGTFVAKRRDPSNAFEEWIVGVFSAFYNFNRLSVSIGGDFNSLNGIRVLSLVWIIFGHTVLTAISPPVTNLLREQQLLQSFEFTGVKGAEYAVDTFFFLSGFLASWGIYHQLQSVPLTGKSYVSIVAARWMRLTPCYAFVLFFFWKVTPHLGSGPLWYSLTSDPMGSLAGCDYYWWSNLLYINNLYPFGIEGNHGICLGWSWYLANDFQYFLLVPFVVALFVMGQKNAETPAKRIALQYGPVCSLVLIQFITTWYSIVLFNTNGSILDPNFGLHVYFKPWCRVTPYALGVALCFFHINRTADKEKNGQDWHLLFGGRRVKIVACFLASLAAMLFVIFSIYDQYKCNDSQVNCNVYGGLIQYGYFHSGNWPQSTIVAYFTFTYFVWSIALGYICYMFFCGYGMSIRWFLSHPVFTPLARLTYNAYLVHMVFMYMVNYALPTLPMFTWSRILSHWIFYTVAAYGVSFIMYMVVEKPFMNLLAKALTRRRAPRVEVTSGNEPLLSSDEHQSPPATMQDRFDLCSDPDSESVYLSSPKPMMVTSPRAVATNGTVV